MNTNMTGFRKFFTNTCVNVLWTKVISALEGLTHLGYLSESVVWTYDTFDSNLIIKNDFTKIIEREILGSVLINIFLLQIFPQLCFCLKDISYNVRPFLAITDMNGSISSK